MKQLCGPNKLADFGCCICSEEGSFVLKAAQAANDAVRISLLHMARKRKSPRNRLLKDNE